MIDPLITRMRLITLISSTNYTNVSNYTNLGLVQLVVNSFNSWIEISG